MIFTENNNTSFIPDYVKNAENNIYFMLGCAKAGIGEIGRSDNIDINIIKKVLSRKNTGLCFSYKINDHLQKNMKLLGLNLDKYFSLQIFKNKIIPIEKYIVNNLEFWENIVTSIKEGCDEYTPCIDGYKWTEKKIDDITLYVLLPKREYYAIIIQSRFRSHLSRLRADILRCVPDNLFHPVFGPRRRLQMIDERNWASVPCWGSNPRPQD